MPAFSLSLPIPRFLRSNRSRTRTPSPLPASPRNDTTAHSLDLVPSHASSSYLPSKYHVPELGASASYPPASGSLISDQSSNAHPFLDRALDDWSDRPSQVSQSVPSSGNFPSNVVKMPSPHAHRSANRRATLLGPPLRDERPVRARHPLAPQPVHYLPTAPSLSSQHLMSPDPYLSQTPPQNQVMLSNAHDFVVNESSFVTGNVGSVNINTSNQFMKELLEKTIPGAEFDSSDRDPPPRCHPGTRLAILDRCLSFIHNSDGQKKMRWVVGAAGVGKSAVMQSVAESPELPANGHASVFFSINGRNEGTKTIITISYQFAAKSEPYRQLIEKAITRDPSLLRSSMAKQFLKFIIEPFIYDPYLSSAGRMLVIIDGLDECKGSRTQVELLRLISDFCIKYPSSPLVWLIASRPETHITSFFANPEVAPAYEKEEIAVDCNEARADVERFLRSELTKIRQQVSDSLDSHWPEERDLWKLANASGGLFAYAQMVVRYIDDSAVGSPASQLSDVLNVIDKNPMTDVPPEEHPMASLDALYARILSKVAPKTMVNTRKLLLALASTWYEEHSHGGNFILLCNWLGMTPDEAYAALNHLRSVLYVPRRDQAHREKLEAFHKSFLDFICDSTRSGFSRDIKHESRRLIIECTYRILQEAPDGFDFGDVNYKVSGGRLVRGPGTGEKISISWPATKGGDRCDNDMRSSLFKLAISEVVGGMECKDPHFQNEFCIRILTTRFKSYFIMFPHFELRHFVFDDSRRQEFMARGILKPMLLKEVDISLIIHEVRLRFRRPASLEISLSDPWNSSCEHERKGVWGNRRGHNWTTMFWHSGCNFCFDRLKLQLDNLTAQSPRYCVPILFTSTGECCVEVRFVDLEDGVSEWTYWFWIRLAVEKRKMYGSTV